MLRKNLLLGFIVLIVATASYAQPTKPKSAKWYEEMGEMYYTNHKYLKALPYLLKYQGFKTNDLDLKLKIAICYIETGRADRAKEYLEFLTTQKDPQPEVYYRLGKTFHLQGEFDKAILYYKKYLESLDDKDDTRYFVKDDIKRCAIGAKLVYQEKLALVENLGDKINTSYDDYAPVISPVYDNIIYFSSIRDGNFGGMIDATGKADTLTGDFRSDIYVSRLVKGEWMATAPLDDRYNTVMHDVLCDFSKDGSIIYSSQSEDMFFDYGDIFINNFFEEGSSKPYKLGEPLNHYDWEGDAFLFNDNTLLFSSDRPGGYGGKDLYLSRRNADGTWSKPANLGARINTPYDEASPFLASDGRTLFFSSNNSSTIGGFDVFRSQFKEEWNNWSEPENLGMSINSPADDAYFRISKDGLRAFFSSSRIGGYGMRDLYVAYFRRPRPEQTTPADSIAFQYALDNGLLASTNGPKADPIAAPDPVLTNNPTTPPTNVESYEFDPLYFGESDMILTAASLSELNDAIRLLKKYPNLRIEISSHIDNDGAAVHYNLFYSIKNAEAISDYIMDNGVAAERVVLKGCGANYPVAKSRNLDGSVIKAGQRYNRRIEIKIYRPESIPIITQYTQPNLIDDMSSKANQIYQKMISGLSYKIQVKVLKTMFDDKILSEFSDPLIETAPFTDNMRYTVGLVKTYTAAKELQRQLAAKGFEEAFIVPYVDGERLDFSEVEAFKNRFPDLSNLLKDTGE